MSYFRKEECGKRKHSLLLQAIFILLLLQQVILANVSNTVAGSLISSLDELCAVVFFLIFCFKSLNKLQLTKQDGRILSFSAALVFIGLISNLFSSLQPFPYVLADVLACNKFIFIYLGIRALYDGKISDDFLYRNFNALAKFFAVVFFVLMLHDYLFEPLFPQADFRYFAQSARLFYPHPTYLANSAVVLLCILISSCDRYKSNKIYICLLASVIVMTLRAKAIAFVVLFFVLLLCVTVLRIKSKSFLFAPLIITGIYIGWNQIQYYFFTLENSARALLTRDCVKIASTYFPLGSGFATFGSHMANLQYSPLYSSFGYGKFYGMSPGNGAFLSDTFWPIIIAQFGYIGLFFFLLIIYNFIQIAFQFRKLNSYRFIALLSILMYMLISSTGESSFFNPFSTLFFIVFGLLACQSPAKNPQAPIPTGGNPSQYIK